MSLQAIPSSRPSTRQWVVNAVSALLLGLIGTLLTVSSRGNIHLLAELTPSILTVAIAAIALFAAFVLSLMLDFPSREVPYLSVIPPFILGVSLMVCLLGLVGMALAFLNAPGIPRWGHLKRYHTIHDFVATNDRLYPGSRHHPDNKQLLATLDGARFDTVEKLDAMVRSSLTGKDMAKAISMASAAGLATDAEHRDTVARGWLSVERLERWSQAAQVAATDPNQEQARRWWRERQWQYREAKAEKQ